MKLRESLVGRWHGHGQKASQEKSDDTDHYEIEIVITEDADKLLAERKIFSFTAKQIVDQQKYSIEKIDDFEFQIKWDRLDHLVSYMYMENPLSFQAAYKFGEFMILDNNFIIESQWQLNLEYQSEQDTYTLEFLLDKEED